jgi:elongation factor G
MSAYATQDIRNIALVGHTGSGKTTLAEALLARTGAIPQAGTVEGRGTVSDFDPLEQSQGYSLDVSVLYLETEGCNVNLLDTPGHPDLFGRALTVLPAVETAAVVVSASAGVEPVTQRMMETAAKRGLDRLVIVNKIDAPDIDLQALLGNLRESFGSECLPLNLPAEGGSRVVDCFFDPEDRPVDFSSVREAHDAMVDQVVEVDEELMTLYLEQGQSLQPDQLHAPFEEALREGHLIPVCFVSARTGAGLDELLRVFTRLMPNPTEGNPPLFLKGKESAAKPVEVLPDPDRHVIGHVFKVSNDPYKGKLAVFRVHQGTVAANSQLYIGDAKKPFKATHLYRLQGSDQRVMNRAIPGDICAVAKVDDLHFDVVVHDSHDEDHHHLKSVECPAPMQGLAIVPARRGDEQKLADAMHKLLDEDPCLRIEHARNETVLWGLGDLHLRMVLERLKSRYHVEVETHPPSVPYRETVTAPAEGHHRHKKQTGGAGQFGEVYLRIEPLPRGGGFEFVDKVVGGAIPNQFIPAVEKGVREALEEGVLAGFPLHDVRVTVYDGKTHPVDGKEVAFIAAGKKAMQEATLAARPVVLEPIVGVRIAVPAAVVGDITGDLSSRRARISGTDHLPSGAVAISALVPLAELGGYESKLKSITGGTGTFSMEFSHYDPVPANVQKQLEEQYRSGHA